MASPGFEAITGGSTWPLQGVRLVKDFTLDLGLIFILGLIVQWVLPQLTKRQRMLMAFPFVLLFLAGTRGLPEFWAKPLMWKSEQLSQEACREAPNVVVVLGGGLAGADDLAVSTVSRVRHAARWASVLHPEQRLNLRVYLSGGPSLPGVPRPEAILMKDAFQAWRPDVKEENLIPEIESLNTRDNATRVAALLKRDFPQAEQNNLNVALVTSWLHMPRALGAFRSAGLKACPVPSPAIDHSSEGFLNFRNGERTVRVLNEYAGFVGYRMMGWLK